jgi:hypothetical protein
MPGAIDKLDKTVLILGAGASQPYGYPLGNALRELLERPHIERDSLVASLGLGDGVDYRNTLIDYSAQTIDEFLGKYERHRQRAKLEIAYHLMKSENPATLMYRDRDRWYYDLYNNILGGDRGLCSDKLSIITFNYDLSLEQYLWRINKARHELTDEAARECVQKLQIVHVHGDVGRFESIHGVGRAYGAMNAEVLSEAASRMLTVHETQETTAWGHAHLLLEEAKHILFLGFGFADENLARLRLGDLCKNGRAFLAPKD